MVSVIKKLTGGLSVLAKQRKVEVVRGVGKFISPHVLEVTQGGSSERIRFEHCIIAAGSEPMRLPFVPPDPRVIDSTGALELPQNPGRFLVIGGGIIGLEMACVYDALGAKVSVVELTPQLMPGCDPDLVRPLEKRIKARYGEILLNTQVTAVTAANDGLQVTLRDQGWRQEQQHLRLCAGRGRTHAQRQSASVPKRPVCWSMSAGSSPATSRCAPTCRISSPSAMSGASRCSRTRPATRPRWRPKWRRATRASFDARVIPSVAYTDPEVAWVGLTESAAKAQNISIEKAVFPWAASGRSLSIGRDEGFTKLLFDPATHRLLGGGIVGTNAGELIAEVALAIEMGGDAADIGLTVHAHPTLSETVAFAAEAFDGTLTDLYMPKKR